MFIRLRNPLEQRGTLFDPFFSPLYENPLSDAAALEAKRRAFPRLNAWESEGFLSVEAELPGLTMEDISLSILGSELSIKGKRSAPEADKARFHRRERREGEFMRIVSLPYEVTADTAEASLRDGVLTIQLPKAASAKPKKISVTS